MRGNKANHEEIESFHNDNDAGTNFQDKIMTFDYQLGEIIIEKRHEAHDRNINLETYLLQMPRNTFF